MTTEETSVWTIGHDGSDGASHAVDWAVAQSAGRSVALRLVRSWQIPALDFPLPVESIEEFAPDRVCDDFDAVVTAAAGAGVPVSQSVIRGAPARVLLEASEDGVLLVVGSRGMGGFRRLLVGSVSSQCAAHARVPTVVVPPSAASDRPVGRIVVGLDGSERSERALAWAAEFAPVDCTILVVGAWMPSKSGFVAVAQHYTDELDAARARFNEILDAVESSTGDRMFERRFAYADPAATLLEEAASADLVVVGQRGHTGISAAILGSVATHVLHHSPVPVVVVPDDD